VIGRYLLTEKLDLRVIPGDLIIVVHCGKMHSRNMSA
jgi:hypothetical protein